MLLQHACVHTFVCVCACLDHTNTHTFNCTCARAHKHRHTHTTHTRTHIQAHTYRHTHTRTHIYTSVGFAHPLAASCDDGSVRMFHVEGGEPGAHYSRTLARLQVCVCVRVCVRVCVCVWLCVVPWLGQAPCSYVVFSRVGQTILIRCI